MKDLGEFELRRRIYQNAHAFFDEGDEGARATYLVQLRDAIKTYDFRMQGVALDAADAGSQAFGDFTCQHCGKNYPHHHYPCPKCGKPTLNSTVQLCIDCGGPKGDQGS